MGSTAKKAKVSESPSPSPSASASPGGSRFSFAAPPSALIRQAQQAKEASLTTSSTTVPQETKLYDFAGEKVE